MHVVEPITDLCPRDICPPDYEPFRQRLSGLLEDSAIVYLHLLLPKELTRGLPEITNNWGQFVNRNDEDSRATGVQRFIQAIKADSKPSLHLLHVVFPHYPYTYLPSGRQYDAYDGYYRPVDPTVAKLEKYQRFLLQLQLADAWLGQLLEKLKREKLYDTSLLIISADHGHSYIPGVRERDIEPANIGDVLPVPLLVKLPGQREGTQSDVPVETLDIFPSIAEFIALQPNPKTDGQSFITAPYREKPQKRVLNIKNLRYWTFSQDQIDRALAQAVRRKIRLFGTNESALYGLGRFPDWWNQPILRLPAGRPTQETVQLVNGQSLQVNSGQTVLPVRVVGRVVPSAHTPLDVAIAVNDRLVAAARTDKAEDGETYFSAMLPESALRTGTNDIKFYKLERSVGGSRLRPMKRQEALTYQLDLKHQRLISSDNKPLPLTSKSLKGWVQQPAIKRDQVLFQGRIDVEQGVHPPGQVLIFRGESYLGYALLSLEAQGHLSFQYVLPTSEWQARREQPWYFVAISPETSSAVLLRSY